MPIDGLSELVRYPRLGIIRLGVKKVGDRGPYPTATDHFVCPPAVEAVYGPDPKELDIIFPADNQELIAPQYWMCYSSSQGLVCKGDGKKCQRKVDVANNRFAGRDTKKWEMTDGDCDPAACPMVPVRRCRTVMRLMFMLPKVEGLGVWQLTTTSHLSIMNINSQLSPNGLIKPFTHGRIAGIPLVLQLVPTKTAPPGEKPKTVYVLQLGARVKLADIMRQALQAPGQVLLPRADEDEVPGDLFPTEVIDTEAGEAPAPKEARPTAKELADRHFAEQMEHDQPREPLKSISGGVSGGGRGFLWDEKAGNDDKGDGSVHAPFRTEARARRAADDAAAAARPAAVVPAAPPRSAAGQAEKKTVSAGIKPPAQADGNAPAEGGVGKAAGGEPGGGELPLQDGDTPDNQAGEEDWFARFEQEEGLSPDNQDNQAKEDKQDTGGGGAESPPKGGDRRADTIPAGSGAPQSADQQQLPLGGVGMGEARLSSTERYHSKSDKHQSKSGSVVSQKSSAKPPAAGEIAEADLPNTYDGWLALEKRCAELWGMQPFQIPKEMGFTNMRSLRESGMSPWSVFSSIRNTKKEEGV